MAQRVGSRGTNALSGLGAGIGDIGESMMKQGMDAKAENRRASLAMLKDLEEKVAAGTLEPEQAAQIAGERGINRDQSYFTSLQPSHENQVKNILTGMGKAGSLQEVPTPTELSYKLPGGPSKSVGFGSIGPQSPDTNPDTGESQLPSTPMGPVSTPDMQTLLGGRQQKIDSFQATPVQNTDDAGNPITQYMNPSKLTGLTTRPQPTAQQKGHLGALTSLIQKGDENAGGLPEMTGEGVQREKLAGEYSQPITEAKGNQEASIATKTANAKLAVEGSPQALEVRRKQQQVDADVKRGAAEAGMDPSFAENYMHHSAFGSYMYLDSSVPMEERKYISRVAQQAGQKAGIPIRFVNREQENALSLIQRAYDNYTYIADTMSQFAAKTASSRVIGGPANTLAALMQSNPQLAAMVTDLPAAMEAAGAQMTGVRGMRMGKELVDNLKKTVPLATDSLATIRYKQIQQAQFLQNAANSILK